MKNNSDPPDSLIKFIIIALGALAWLWVGYSLYQVFAPNLPKRQIERQYSSIILVGGNCIKASSPPVMIEPQVLGIFYARNDISYDEILLLEEIIKRESDGNPNICNKQYGCKSGMGLTQLIPSTVRYCESKLGKSINPFNPEDNLECAIWLLQNEGIRHWQKWSGPYDDFL